MNTRSRRRPMLIVFGLFCSLSLFSSRALFAQTPVFTVIPLGVRGGLDESNLSSYLVSAAGSKDYICLDAGTLYAGIRKAIDNGTLSPPVNTVIREGLSFFSPPHPLVDQGGGLTLIPRGEGKKNIWGLPFFLKA